MRHILYPDYYVQSVYELPVAALKAAGIRVLFFDIDNTLEPYDVKEAGTAARALFQALRKEGFSLIILSNNKERRVRIFAKSLRARYISRAGKPLAGKLKKALFKLGARTEEAAVIGDQIFTDVLCGRLAGIVPILTKPLCDRDQFVTKIKRPLDRFVVKRYLQREERR